MKDAKVQKSLDKLARKFQAVKKYKPAKLLDDIVSTMDPIGGITGFHVRSYGTITLDNHTAKYNLPIRYEEHSDNLSSFGKRAYSFLEAMRDELSEQGVSPRKMEYHLGKAYASKDHDPTK